MELSKEIQEKIEELRILESNSQNLLMQKQNSQIELNEVNNALKEVKSSSGDIYKVSANIMLKANKDQVLKDLEEQKKILELKISSVEKQESIIDKKSEELKKEVNAAISKKSK